MPNLVGDVGFWLVLELPQHPHVPCLHHCLKVGTAALQIQRHSWYFLSGRDRLEIAGMLRCVPDHLWGVAYVTNFSLNKNLNQSQVLGHSDSYQQEQRHMLRLSYAHSRRANKGKYSVLFHYFLSISHTHRFI